MKIDIMGQEVEVMIVEDMNRTGNYNPLTNEIYINPHTDDPTLTLVHEMAHLITAGYYYPLLAEMETRGNAHADSVDEITALVSHLTFREMTKNYGKINKWLDKHFYSEDTENNAYEDKDTGQ